jgi:hypothetical protein
MVAAGVEPISRTAKNIGLFYLKKFYSSVNTSRVISASSIYLVQILCKTSDTVRILTTFF